MKSNELRIGNLLFRDGFEVEIDSIQKNLLAVKGENFYNPIKYFEPIKISEEWLLKFGFEETYCSKFRLKFDHPCNFIGFDFSKTDEKSMEGFRYYGHYFKIKYVHQLQNIYYAVTGEELNCL